MKKEEKALPKAYQQQKKMMMMMKKKLYEIEGKYSLQKLVEGNEAWSEIES
jgi:hypothetical protein